jgi:hypothetical protein
MGVPLTEITIHKICQDLHADTIVGKQVVLRTSGHAMLREEDSKRCVYLSGCLSVWLAGIESRFGEHCIKRQTQTNGRRTIL